MTPDGSLYGVTPGEAMNVVPALVSTLFRLRPNGGSYIYEVLRTFDFATTGVSGRAELGARRRRPDLTATPSRAAPSVPARSIASIPPPAARRPIRCRSPSCTSSCRRRPGCRRRPWPAPDGLLLFGSTSQGGSPAQRGAIYALDPTTGAVTIRASIPGTPPGTWRTANTSLIVGADNALYGTHHRGDDDRRRARHRAVRVRRQRRDERAQQHGARHGRWPVPIPPARLDAGPGADGRSRFRPGEDALPPGHERHGDGRGHRWRRERAARTGARAARRRVVTDASTS